MITSVTTSPDFLISNQEREVTCAALSHMFGEGRLTCESYEQRLAQVLQATSVQDLTRAVEYLPIVVPTPQMHIAAVQAPETQMHTYPRWGSEFILLVVVFTIILSVLFNLI